MNKALTELNLRCGRFFSSLWPGEEKVLVFGAGNDTRPELMLIGEAPGEQEVLAGQPFVGKAGKNLTAFLDGVALDRRDVFITNVVKMRPTKVSEKRRVVNRPPSKEEIGLFLPYLKEEIAVINPKIVVTLGNVALRALHKKDSVIGACHGQSFQVTVAPPVGKAISKTLFALYHPASVIYNRQLQAVYEADLEALKKLIHGE